MRPSRAWDNPPVLMACSLRSVSSDLDRAGASPATLGPANVLISAWSNAPYVTLAVGAPPVLMGAGRLSGDLPARGRSRCQQGHGPSPPISSLRGRAP